MPKKTAKTVGKTEMSKSLTSLDMNSNAVTEKSGTKSKDITGLLPMTNPLSLTSTQIFQSLSKAQALYNSGAYSEALSCCEKVYEADAYRSDNLLLLGAVHFQLRNFSESIFYNQQCIRVDPNFAEAYSNLGNALKELGDLKGATQFYLKVCIYSQW